MDTNNRDTSAIEEWRVIPGFSRYHASNLGRIKTTNWKCTHREAIMTPADSGGYLKTMLKRDDGKYCSKTVHFFIALAFFGPRPDGLEVNHKDGVKHNNSIGNIEYTTRSENLLHACRMGLMPKKRGSVNGMAKLTESEVIAIRQHAANNGRNYGRLALARKYGVSESQIKDIVTRRRNIWPHV